MPEGLSTLEVKASRGQRCIGAHISQNQSCGSREGRPGPAPDRKEVSHSASQVSLGTSCKDCQRRLLGPRKVSSVKTEEPDDPEGQHRRSGTGPSAGAWSVFLEVKLRLLGAGMALRRM